MNTSRLLLSLSAFVLLFSCKREGCTDQTAINYDSKAKKENFTCIYADGSTNNPNDPGSGNNPNDPGGVNLPIQLSGTENSSKVIANQSNSPSVADYYISSTWTINAAVTIEPGVRIEMRPGARILITANGSLNATGTPTNKIEFFGAQDVAGYWYNIEINSNNPNNKLIHCNISNGSSYYGSEPGMVIVANNAQLTVQNSTFSKGSEHGLMAKGLAKLPDFYSNYFSGFEKAPIRLASLQQAGFLDNSTTFGSNQVQSIYVYGAAVEGNTSIPDMGIPYSVRDHINFSGGHTTVQSGVDIEMAANIRLNVQANASLEFAGTASNPCSVSGEVNAKGYWYNITYSSNNPANIISYTNISDGRDYYGSEAGLLRLSGSASVSMNNSYLSNAGTIAVGGSGSSTFIDGGGNTWNDCDGGGGLLP